MPFFFPEGKMNHLLRFFLREVYLPVPLQSRSFHYYKRPSDVRMRWSRRVAGGGLAFSPCPLQPPCVQSSESCLLLWGAWWEAGLGGGSPHGGSEVTALENGL